jgi:CheY-like chemotaxis protein
MGESLRGLHVLVVDDDDNVRDALVALIRADGGTATGAASALEARLALSRRIPDAIISDLSMPGEDGCEFIAGLRREEAGDGRPPVPAAVITAAEIQDPATLIAAGFQRVVKKPIEANQLPRLILELLGR